MGVENLQREGRITHEQSSAGHIRSNNRVRVGVVGEALLGAVDEISSLGAVCKREHKRKVWKTMKNGHEYIDKYIE